MHIGCFYFKRTASGNLLGEFSDNQGDRVYTECADIVERDETDAAGFAGRYLSAWRHVRGKHAANLAITRNTGDNLLYAFVWDEGKYEYTGHGMLCDGVITGGYIITKEPV